jgi:hypothetical protein
MTAHVAEAGAGDGPLLVVDAANVIGSRPDGWWRDRAGAAERLVEQLRREHAGLGDYGGIAVVLEGAARRGAPPGLADSVRVFHAEGSGDDAIVAVVAAAGDDEPARDVTVVTADRGLRGRVEALGAVARGPSWLWRRVRT